MISFSFKMGFYVKLLYFDLTGQTRIFNESELYQRAFLHWNRAAVQGECGHPLSLRNSATLTFGVPVPALNLRLVVSKAV